MKKHQRDDRITELLRRIDGPDGEAVVREIKERRAAAWRQLEGVEVPLISALATTGVNVHSVWDLVNSTDEYPEAVPVLIEHIQRDYPDRIREGIARALAVPYAESAWSILLSLYRNRTDSKTTGFKAGLAVALSAVAGPGHIEELVELVCDTSQGPTRALLLPALARSRRPNVIEVLERLRADPQLTDAVRSCQRRVKRMR
jgi:hypothetical protein